MVARRPVCPLRVLRVYNKVADLGDVDHLGQGISIVDIHEPAIAMPLRPFLYIVNWYIVNGDPYSRFQIFLVGRDQEVC
jgi:hypothetical protein